MYNKQTWLDEIPDMTKPIYDASGKQKTDPQTGRPLFELVQVGTRITSNRLNTMEGGIEAAHTLVEQLAKELGGNFVASINGTMGLQCSAQGLKASWTSGIAYVGGRRYQVAAGEMSLNPTQGQYLYVDTDGVVKKTTSQTTAQKGLLFFYVATDTSGVISTTDHRVNVSLEEILKKLKDIDIEEAVTGGASGLMTGADAKFVRVDGETKTGAQEKADAVKDYVESRLDTSERRAVTLQPGLQVLEATKNAPFALTGLKGRTLVNVLGRAGRFTNLNDLLTQGNHSVALSSGNKIDGDNALLLNCGGKGGVQNLVRLTDLTFENDAFYVGIMNAKATAPGTLHSELYGSRGSVRTQNLTTDWKKVVYRFIGTSGGQGLHFWNELEAANAFYIDGVRVIKVSEAEYTTATDSELIAKYPYVDSVQPVRNPYAIRYGENLLPPFYEWTLIREPYVVTSPYSLSGLTAGGVANSTIIDVIPNTDYTFSVEHNGNIGVYTEDGLTEIIGYTTAQSITFNSGNNKKIRTYLNGLIAGTFTFKNPMLNIGTTAKPFKPREDSMLALQTDLYADPLTGANADEVFEKDGQYFKLAKWKKVVLDGSINWSYSASSSAAGYKGIAALALATDSVARSAIITKYNGVLTLTKQDGQINGADQNNGIGGGNLYLSVPTADSGWGDSYTPTADEIKAYFMGYKMYVAGGNADVVYNGTGTKAWAARTGTNKAWVHYSEVVPTTITPEVGYTPYQLVYQLATPTVEPITSEGQLTVIEGNNQVEVGTGIVLREYALVPANSNPNLSGRREINFTQVPASLLKNKARSILAIYRNGVQDRKWTISDNAVDSYGTSRANIPGALYDPSAAYSVTYFMLDTSPIAPFVGSAAENEKALLTDLVQDVQQANARLSVVENKKADEDSPAWITPTLLNGWVNFSNGFSPAGYHKDSSGYVHIRGLIKSGFGGAFFMLPKGYRPAHALAMPTISAANAAGDGALPASINIFPDGTVITAVNFQSGFMSLEGISFLAEQ